MEKRFWEVLRTSGRVWESVEAFQVLRGFGSWKQAFGGSSSPGRLWPGLGRCEKPFEKPCNKKVLGRAWEGGGGLWSTYKLGSLTLETFPKPKT